MTRFHLISDVHLEFGGMPTPMGDTSDVILLVAGDFGQASNSEHVGFMRKLCKRYRMVLHTAGNHEYYGSRIDKVDQAWTLLEDEILNYRYLNPGFEIIDDVTVVGATLWTDFNGNDPIAKLHAERVINDYRKITFKAPGDVYRKLRASDVVQVNNKHRNYIEDCLRHKKTSKVLVMTHHAPTEHGVDPSYRSDYPANYAYHNVKMEGYLDQADVWVHGHTHHQYEAQLGETRLICHPRGYLGYEASATNYSPKEFTL
jgi:predicted phosphohydrolase